MNWRSAVTAGPTGLSLAHHKSHSPAQVSQLREAFGSALRGIGQQILLQLTMSRTLFHRLFFCRDLSWYSRNSRDDPGAEIDLSDHVVLGVRNEQISRMIHSHTFGFAQTDADGLTSI